MKQPLKPRPSTAIGVGPGQSITLEDVNITGFDRPIEIAESARVSLKDVRTYTPTRTDQHPPRSVSVGWSPALQYSYDPSSHGTITKRTCGRNPFDGPRVLIDAARRHCKDLESGIDAFVKGEPYAVVVEDDPETGQKVHKARLVGTLPMHLASMARDALTNLRDTLDHAVYASTISINPGTRPQKTAFPFSSTASGVSNRLKQLTDVAPEIGVLLEKLKPHETGNRFLWGINKVRNVEVHKFIVPLITSAVASSLRINGRVQGRAIIGHSLGSNNEVEFLRVPPNASVEYEPVIIIRVVFGDVECLGGYPVLDTLDEAVNQIEGVVFAIENETARHLRSID